MRTSQSFGVHFTIKKDKAKDGVTNVYACITINKDRIHFALKHYVKVENWDKVDVSDICYTLFRGKTDHLFAGKEMQQMH